jgi:hypothetical protein
MKPDSLAFRHFLALARRGQNPPCSTGESAAWNLATAAIKEGLSLDQDAIKGFIEFVRFAKAKPSTAKELLW